LTKLAADICGTNISLISFIDENRQWFKSRYGLQAEETPRDISWCGYTILGEDIFEVKDSAKDERFKNNPLILGFPHVHYYAGAPLITEDNQKLGTICVIKDRTYERSDWQRELLKTLARQVILLLEGRIRESKLKDANARLEFVLDSAELGTW